MGYIKEPEGIDFVINGKPLTNEQKQAISEYIRADKSNAIQTQSARIKQRKQSGICRRVVKGKNHA
jgi:hypothetical protein